MFCTQKLVSFSSPLAADCHSLARTVWSQSVLFVLKHLAISHLSVNSQESPSFHNFHEYLGNVQPSPENSTQLSHRGILVLGSHRISIIIYILSAHHAHTPPRAHTAQEVSGVPGRAHALLPQIQARSIPQLSHISSPGKVLVPYSVRLQASVRMVQTARKFCLKDKFKPLAKQ